MDYYDMECPYCGKGVYVDRSDGEGTDESELYEMECPECNKYFTYRVMIHFMYTSYEANCLNDGEHVWEAPWTIPEECTKMQCANCNESRLPTEEEWVMIKEKRKNFIKTKG